MKLLMHLSPAAAAGANAVRAVRMKLGRSADVGTEYAVWNHPDTEAGSHFLRIRRGAHAKWLSRLAGKESPEDAALKGATAEILEKHAGGDPDLRRIEFSGLAGVFG